MVGQRSEAVMAYDVGTPGKTIVPNLENTADILVPVQVLQDLGGGSYKVFSSMNNFGLEPTIYTRTVGATASTSVWVPIPGDGVGVANIKNAARALPLIALGNNTDVTITWDSAFPNAGYTIRAAVASPTAGAASCAVQSQTASGCVVRVTANSLISVGTVLDVIGYN